MDWIVSAICFLMRFSMLTDYSWNPSPYCKRLLIQQDASVRGLKTHNKQKPGILFSMVTSAHVPPCRLPSEVLWSWPLWPHHKALHLFPAVDGESDTVLHPLWGEQLWWVLRLWWLWVRTARFEISARLCSCKHSTLFSQTPSEAVHLVDAEILTHFTFGVVFRLFHKTSWWGNSLWQSWWDNHLWYC